MIYGTAFKMSDPDVDVISHQIANFMSPNLSPKQRAEIIRLENKLKCADVFDYYAKSITGGD